MQNDPATVGASDSDHFDLVDVTLNDGKYTIRQVAGGGWECLRYGEPWPAFAGRQPDNLHTALACEVDHLRRLLDAAVAASLRSGEVNTAAKALVAAIDSEPRSTWAPNADRPTWERDVYGPAVRALKLALESRESTHAGLAPAPGAEATAGTDAGGTAARNMFAAHALPSVILTAGPGKPTDEIAQICFCIADAMVAEALSAEEVKP